MRLSLLSLSRREKGRKVDKDLLLVRPERLELPALWFEARCSIQLSYGRNISCLDTRSNAL